MKAIKLEKPYEIEEVETAMPQPKAGEALIRVKSAGICGSDIGAYRGTNNLVTYPRIIGHEIAGEVLSIPENEKGIKAGDKVIVDPYLYCGHCYPCSIGRTNCCEDLHVLGVHVDGGMSEYFCHPADMLVKVPDDMDWKYIPMAEPLTIALHGLHRTQLKKGEHIAVIGAGPIGNLVAQTAKGMGAARVMITDVSDFRLDKAKECGIDVCVNTKKKDFGEAMIEAFGPDKADVIYDCAGNNVTMGQAIKYARKGSVIVLVAVFADMATIDLAVANDHELDIKSTMMYRHEDYVGAITLVNEGKVHLRPLISKVFAFKDYLKAYQYIDANRETTMKVIINVQEK